MSMVRLYLNSMNFRVVAHYCAVASIVVSVAALLQQMYLPLRDTLMQVPVSAWIGITVISALLLVSTFRFTDVTSHQTEQFPAPVPDPAHDGESRYYSILSNLLLATAQQMNLQVMTAQEYTSALDDADKQLRTPIDRGTLESTVEVLIERTMDIRNRTGGFEEKLRSAQSEIASLSDRLAHAEKETMTDPLTGLSNRRHLEKFLDEQIEISREHEYPMSLALIDIDFFKSINDRFGHTVGDQVLRAFAEAINKTLRNSDFVARYGGEEFAVILPQTNADTAATVQTKLLSVLQSKKWFLENSKQEIGPITASIGSTQLRSNDTQSTLMERADQALYRAKRNGRNQIAKIVA